MSDYVDEDLFGVCVAFIPTRWRIHRRFVTVALCFRCQREALRQTRTNWATAWRTGGVTIPGGFSNSASYLGGRSIAVQLRFADAKTPRRRALATVEEHETFADVTTTTTSVVISDDPGFELVCRIYWRASIGTPPRTSSTACALSRGHGT